MSDFDIHCVAQIAKLITADFYQDGLDLSARNTAPNLDNAWARMPEVACVNQLRASRVSDRDIRLFLTFIAAMDRARDATRLWNDGIKLFQAHPELFEPLEVSAIPLPKLRELLREYRVSQRHNPDSHGWRTIAHSLATEKSPISRAVDFGVGDTKVLFTYLRSSFNGRHRFPFLRGPKIGPMWVRMLVAPGGAKIDNLEIIPVAVDTHVRRVTQNLRISDTENMSLNSARPIIQKAWHDAVSATGIGGPSGIADTCAALDPALWTFGKYGCSHCAKIGQAMPISNACDRCKFRTNIGS